MNQCSDRTIFQPNLITEKILYLDGLSRAGKFLLGKLVSHFEGVEYFQYVPLLEHLPILSAKGKMAEEDATSYFRMSLNMAVYDRVIGRGLNRRKNESSSILNSYEASQYFAREEMPDGSDAVERWKGQDRRVSFLTHECAPFWRFLERANPLFEMIHIQRHPIDLAHSWWKRGWGERWGTDPLAFIPVFGSPNEIPYPWFAETFAEKFRGASPVDRVLQCIRELYRMENDALDEMKRERKKLLSVDYESFFDDPKRGLALIGNFLGKNPFPRPQEILEREGCMTPLDPADRARKIAELHASASPTLVEALMETASEYERRWS